MNVTAFDLAQRWIGTKEAPGPTSEPFVLGMLRLEDPAVRDDATAWCSAFVNFVAWQLRLPRSKSLAARSWLAVGRAVALEDARAAFDVVVLKRGAGAQPGPEVVAAPGHVGFFAGVDGEFVQILGGNQGDQVSIARFPRTQVLGVRRIYDGP